MEPLRDDDPRRPKFHSEHSEDAFAASAPPGPPARSERIRLSPEDARTLPIIFAALLVSTVIYAVLGFVGTRGGSGLPLSELFRRPLVVPLYACAAGSYSLAFLISGIVQKSGKPPRVVYITRWALLESIVIFGLIATIISHDVRVLIAPWLLSLIGFAQSYPSADTRA